MKPIKQKNDFQDPVCGMIVDIDKNPMISVFNGKINYFCSFVCFRKFEKDPSRYTAAWQKPKIGWLSRYLDRVKKATGGKPPCCH